MNNSRENFIEQTKEAQKENERWMKPKTFNFLPPSVNQYLLFVINELK